MKLLIAILLTGFCEAQSPVERPFFSNSAVFVYGGKVSCSPDGQNTVQVIQLKDDNFTSAVKIIVSGREVHEQIKWAERPGIVEPRFQRLCIDWQRHWRKWPVLD
jgi:hypothetical protein